MRSLALSPPSGFRRSRSLSVSATSLRRLVPITRPAVAAVHPAAAPLFCWERRKGIARPPQLLSLGLRASEPAAPPLTQPPLRPGLVPGLAQVVSLCFCELLLRTTFSHPRSSFTPGGTQNARGSGSDFPRLRSFASMSGTAGSPRFCRFASALAFAQAHPLARLADEATFCSRSLDIGLHLATQAFSRTASHGKWHRKL